MDVILNQLKKQPVLMEGREKVILRSMKKPDLPRIKKWLEDRELIELGFGLQADEKSLNKIAATYYQKLQTQNEFFLAIENKENLLIGFARFLPVNDTLARVGIMIGEKAYWSKGCGTEAMELLLKFLFEVIRFEKVELDTADFNQRAQRCFEKVGFRRVGESSDLDFNEGSFCHKFYMEITREQYLQDKLDKA